MIATSTFAERRHSVRQAISAPALVLHWGSTRQVWESASLQDFGASGFRLRTGLQVRDNDVILILRETDRKPICAEVVWSRKDGLVEKGLSGRCGQAFLAGCRLRLEPPPRFLARMMGTAGRGLAVALKVLARFALVAAVVALFAAALYSLVFLLGVLLG